MAGSRIGNGRHLAAFVSRGVMSRTEEPEGLGGARQPMAETPIEPADRNGNGLHGDPAPAAPQAAPRAPARPAASGPAPLPAREGAVEAYCLELCGAERMRVAVEEVIASPRLSAPLATVPEPELLRVTRATASGFAPIVHQPGVRSASTQAGTRECGLTLPRLARRDDGELDRYSAAALRAHLETCLICRAAEARHDRAERAFSAVLGLRIAAVPSAPEAEAEEPPAVEEPPAPVSEEPPAVVEAEPEVAVEEPEPAVAVDEPPPASPAPEAEAAFAPPPPVLPLVAPRPVLPDEPAPLEPETPEAEAAEPEAEALEAEALEPEALEPETPEPETLEPEPEAPGPEAIEDTEPARDEQPPEQMRGLVVMPAAPAAAAPSVRVAAAAPLQSRGRRSWELGRWRVLIATLAVGVVVIVIIALLWSNGSSGPDPHALPPASAASGAVALGAVTHRLAPPNRSPAARRTIAKGTSSPTPARGSTGSGSGTPSAAGSSSASGAGSSAGSSSGSSAGASAHAAGAGGSSSSGSQSGGSGQSQPSGQGSPSGPVVSQSGGGKLPPAKAPTKTIGSMFQ